MAPLWASLVEPGKTQVLRVLIGGYTIHMVPLRTSLVKPGKTQVLCVLIGVSTWPPSEHH